MQGNGPQAKSFTVQMGEMLAVLREESRASTSFACCLVEKGKSVGEQRLWAC